MQAYIEMNNGGQSANDTYGESDTAVVGSFITGGSDGVCGINSSAGAVVWRRDDHGAATIPGLFWSTRMY
jgi:hypothetical protein